MTEERLLYDDMIQEALRGVMAQAIEIVEQNGPQGEHHFLIVFRSEYPGVEMSQALLRRFPHEMTIVLQHQFWDLKTDSTGFEVDLSFNNVMEHLRIPYAAVKAFTDPSVKFGLQFHVEDAKGAPESQEAEVHTLKDEQASGAPSSTSSQDKTTKDAARTEETTGAVVSLDAFRKK